jgi:hypothetical protein
VVLAEPAAGEVLAVGGATFLAQQDQAHGGTAGSSFTTTQSGTGRTRLGTAGSGRKRCRPNAVPLNPSEQPAQASNSQVPLVLADNAVLNQDAGGGLPGGQPKLKSQEQYFSNLVRGQIRHLGPFRSGKWADPNQRCPVSPVSFFRWWPNGPAVSERMPLEWLDESAWNQFTNSRVAERAWNTQSERD